MVLTLMLKKGHSRQDCGPKSKNYNICSKKKVQSLLKEVISLLIRHYCHFELLSNKPNLISIVTFISKIHRIIPDE